MPTRAEMLEKLKSIGLKKRYKPIWDSAGGVPDDVGSILLEVRRPAKIVNGELDGAQIDIYNDKTVRVWTSQKKKANAIAVANKFQVRLFDGEAELYLPADRADEFLHGLGAKVRATKTMTPEQHAATVTRLRAMAQARKRTKPTAS